MGIYGPASTPPKSATEVVTSISPTLVSSTVINANALRSVGSYIVNYGTKIMYISWGATAAATTNAFTAVPANGGAIDFPEDYIGPVQAIWAAGVTGTAYSHEFTSQ
jgi:hypothetical protein